MHLSKNHILRLAARHGMTQSQLASELGISKSSLSNALSGRRGASATVIIDLLRIFPKESIVTICDNENFQK